MLAKMWDYSGEKRREFSGKSIFNCLISGIFLEIPETVFTRKVYVQMNFRRNGF